MDLLVVSIAERPDLAPLLADFPGAWPEFMFHDQVGVVLYDRVVAAHPDFCLVAIDPQTGRPVAKACSLPFTWAGAGGLPPGGYDAVLLGAADDRLAGRRGNMVSAVEIVVRQEARGAGVSAVMLDALRRNTARLGYTSLVAPVRPNGKHEYPDVPMAEYARRTRPDGLPADPWLRVHIRAGGRIVGVAARSMTIAGTLDEWRDWTGLPFDTPGPVYVPGALAPVHCDVAAGHAVYVEPNVWVHHAL